MRGYYNNPLLALVSGIALGVMYLGQNNTSSPIKVKNPNEVVCAKLLLQSMESEGIRSGEEYNYYKKIVERG